MTLFLRYAAKSDVGIVRRENEDSGFAGSTLLAVADGMGGHAAGELASSTAIATLAELDSEILATQDVLTELDDAILTSAERIAQFIQADPTRAGMGTTVTAIAWIAGRIAVVHVGDSRAYVLRDGELSQITRDHTYVQSLVDSGRISAEEARHHPKRNLLLRAIDGNQLPERDLSIREAQAGDRYLLCSDGLSGVVTDKTIQSVLTEIEDPTAAVTALVDLALEAGAPDNVTAVVADVIELEDAEAVAEAALGVPVVVGAAGESRNRAALPGLAFPDDVGPGGTGPAGEPTGPAVAGGLATRGAERNGAGGEPDREPPSEPSGQTQQDSQSWARSHWRVLSVVGVAVTGLVIGAIGFLWWLSSQWFVGADAGYVATFQGIPQQIAGIEVNRVVSRSALEVADLPYYDQQQVTLTIEASTQSEAERIVADLAKKAEACDAEPIPLGCPIDPVEGSGAGGAPSASATDVSVTAFRTGGDR